MRLFGILRLLLLAKSANGASNYTFGAPTNGKLVYVLTQFFSESGIDVSQNNNENKDLDSYYRHEMRTFLNMTVDWSSRNASKGAIKIPKCHEMRIRTVSLLNNMKNTAQIQLFFSKYLIAGALYTLRSKHCGIQFFSRSDIWQNATRSPCLPDSS